MQNYQYSTKNVEAAISSYEHGASAIIVSNHGARQLDGVPATIDVLHAIGNFDSNTC